MKENSRFLTIKILVEFEKKIDTLKDLRNNCFKLYGPKPLVRSRVMAFTNEIIRLKGRLDFLICSLSSRKIKRIDKYILNILRLGFYEILYDENIPNYATVDSLVNIAQKSLSKKAGGFVNAILRNLTREKDKNSNFLNKFKNSLEWNSFPIWLQTKWKNDYGKKNAQNLINFFNQKQHNYFRFNDINSSEEIQRELKNNNIKYESFNKNFFKLNSGTSELLNTNLFKNGTVSIQDPAAGAVVDLLNLKSDEIVLDICAAPGTKSLSIADKVGKGGKVFAYDNNKLRIKKAKQDILRHKKRNIYWELKDATCDRYPLSDKILLDVPCSGTGVIGNKPDIRWMRELKDISKMSILQLKILKNVSKYLKTGGSLVYATCSLEKEENWNVIENFLKINLNFKLGDLNKSIPLNWIDVNGCLSTLPNKHDVGGMFAAKLTRL